MKPLALLVWLFLTAGVLHGQSIDTISIKVEDGNLVLLDSQRPRTKNPSTVSGSSTYASEKIEIRKFDQNKWREIVESRNYTDARSLKPQQDQNTNRVDSDQRPGPRALDDDDQGRYDYDMEEGTNLGWIGPLGQILFYAAIAAIIVLILLQIVRNVSFKLNPKRTSTSADNPDKIHDISELDTEDLIRKAHNARDFKLAIRLYFLDLLKKLNENGQIVWTKDKTNRDYLSELFSKQYFFDEVRRLTLAYESVWYGEHIPTEERYQELRNEFHLISQKFKV